MKKKITGTHMAMFGLFQFVIWPSTYGATQNLAASFVAAVLIVALLVVTGRIITLAMKEYM